MSNNKIFGVKIELNLLLTKQENELFFSLITTLKPAFFKASNPPSTCETFQKPISKRVLVASADLKPNAQKRTIFYIINLV